MVVVEFVKTGNASFCLKRDGALAIPAVLEGAVLGECTG